jgi:hypothetical protein
MITREDQLKNKANFIGKDGKLYLVRCMACPCCGERGRENYSFLVASGKCAFCGWYEKEKRKMSNSKKSDTDLSHDKNETNMSQVVDG